MRYIKLLVASVILVSMTACLADKSELDMQGYIKTINVVGPDKIAFEPISGTGQTKATSVDDGIALVFNWAAGDTLGIFPNKGNQVEFPITAEVGTTSATFDGGGWALRNNASYAAYYPFSVWNYFQDNKTIMLDYSGQVQDGNGSFAHLSAYDFLASAKTTPENNSVTFQMERQGSILYIDIVVPEPATITSLTISCDEAIFVEKAALDISGNNPMVTPVETKESLTLNFENTATMEQNETVRAYMAVQPVDFSAKTVTATLVTDASTYTAPVVSRVVNKGKAAFLRFSDSFTDNTSLGDPIDLSAEETANSYIVSEAGYYSINATVAGNGNAVRWPDAFAPYAYPAYNASTRTVAPFTGNGVEVILNQNNCVSNVSYKDGKILFKATGNEGNAKLTLTNAGAGVWTWHIWCTDTPAVFAYDAGAYDLYHIMDRNMGAISDGSDNATCEEVSGLYYQYGNPIGYTYEDFYNQGYQGYEFNGRGIATQQYALALNPNKPILNVTPGEGKDFYWFDLWYEGVPDKIVYSKLWGGGCDIDGSLKYGDEVVKTLYDPCPAGYKIMGWDTFEELSTAETYSANSKGLFVPAEDGDIFIPYNGAAWPDAEDGTPMYMARGPYREVEGVSIYATLWLSGHVGRNMAYFNNFSAKNASTAAYNHSSSATAYYHIVSRGLGVRCVADEFDYE